MVQENPTASTTSAGTPWRPSLDSTQESVSTDVEMIENYTGDTAGHAKDTEKHDKDIDAVDIECIPRFSGPACKEKAWRQKYMKNKKINLNKIIHKK